MRRAGILMPVFSLPSPYGVGTLGAAAREFILFLEQAGQSCWQTLPLGPTGYGDSPYQSYSSYAGNHYLIDLDELASQGLLLPEEYRNIQWSTREGQVDYGKLYAHKTQVLRLAVTRLLAQHRQAVEEFCQRHHTWLEEYALFMALKEEQVGAPWSMWPEPLRLRQPQALDQARQRLWEEVDFWRGVQYLFFRQWEQVKAFAHAHGVSIIGDLPIYVSLDSADVWSAPGQFQLDENLVPTEVAGCPPDGFSARGQLWGNPLFRWEEMAQDGYRWWVERIAFQFQLYDVLRIDHFRGFDQYYAIPYGSKDARGGKWRPGPGLALFQAVEQAIGKREIIAEDLGFLSDSVRQLVKDTGFPGMKVLELAFDSRDDSGWDYLPHRCTPNSVMYTGTHDNSTILGWRDTAPEEDVALAQRYFFLNEEEGWHWGMMRGAWSSVSDLAVMQMQDVLGLGDEARINTPSTLGENWQWRAWPGCFTPALAQRLRQAMALYGRLPCSGA